MFALDDLLLALLVAFLAREVLVALLATVGARRGAPERVFNSLGDGDDGLYW